MPTWRIWFLYYNKTLLRLVYQIQDSSWLILSLNARHSPLLLISIWILSLFIIFVHYQLHKSLLHRLGDQSWIPLPCKIAQKRWFMDSIKSMQSSPHKHCIRSQLNIHGFTYQQWINLYNYSASMMSSLILIFSLSSHKMLILI